jgi:hypothetical protein
VGSGNVTVLIVSCGAEVMPSERVAVCAGAPASDT